MRLRFGVGAAITLNNPHCGKRFGTGVGTVLWLAVLVTGRADGGKLDQRIDYNREIRPILSKNCFPCHGPDEARRAKKLRLDLRDAAVKPLADGAIAIVPGDPDSSEVVLRITEDDPTLRMPPRKTRNPLTRQEVERIERWIEEGAHYAGHWSLTPPRAQPLPWVAARSWPNNGIDFWILARLEKQNLKPAPEADRFNLLRRLSLDLRGLPPTPGEVDQFTGDTAPDAYEKAVDRFLSDPAFGERWARMWLDLARYADSAGYGSDPLRMIWRYRDWVIDAFNRNLPFDRFTIEQLAGDLLPHPTASRRIATAFHRNTMTNTEGGTDDEEFRVAAVKDRVDTTMEVWMGLTMGCAKCHSHKYDPITQEEYYRFYSFFNQTADTDKPDEQPTMPTPTPTIASAIDRINARIAVLRKQMEAPSPQLAAGQAEWENGLRPKRGWFVLKPLQARSESGAKLAARADGSLKVDGKKPGQDAYTITARTHRDGITAFRLEAIADPSLPGGGAGRAPDGRFVLSRFAVQVQPAGAEPQVPVGRFVRVEVPGARKDLALAEVEVFSRGQNVALKGAARQSSTAYGGAAARAADGNTNGNYFEASSTTHTRTEANPWWEVKLAGPEPIERIVVWNRTDGYGAGLAGFRVQLLDDARQVVWRTGVAGPPDPSLVLSTAGPRPVSLARALADFTQKGFQAADVLKPAANPTKGWSVAPETQKNHAVTFLIERPSSASIPQLLTFRIEQRYKEPGYTLGRFRLVATTDPAATRWLEIPEAILTIAHTPPEKRTAGQNEAIARHYRSISSALRPIREQIAQLDKARPAVPTVPVMVELPPDRRRTTHLMHKGSHLAPGAKVEPGVPAALNPFPAGAPGNRLGLATWLVDPTNPLTARVAVNRLWSQIFGTGIVETEEDFGTQGEPPSHPELLDWLALEYRRMGWDTKAMLRLIVTSATYRQSSKVSPELEVKDPRNRLLARAPRLRLEAEMVRDQALALSGLLTRKVGGPSVFPPQPAGLWQAAFNGQRTWAASQGDDRWRRGLYTFWRRTVPYPSMAAFDAPSREICAVRRSRTNTPLQALVTLNDPVYVEAAQALARRIWKEGGASPVERAGYALRLCLCRPPRAAQVETLVKLYTAQYECFHKDPQAAKSFAADPLGPLPAGMDPAELAAWTAVANVLLNLDGVLTKG